MTKQEWKSFFNEKIKLEFSNVHLTGDNVKDLDLLSESYLDDLFSIPGFYFSEADQIEITIKAVQKLKTLFSLHPEIKPSWIKVVTDFHQSQYWGYPCSNQKPMPKKQVKSESLIPYLWAAFQALLIMKVIILYFGFNTEDSASPNNKYYVVLAILFSVFSLVFFAWRHYKKED